MLKRLLLIISVTLVTLFTSCSDNRTIREKGEIVVAMDLDMPGFFTLNGENYGYQYDLLKAYADYVGLPLRVISQNSPSTYRDMLEEGSVDIVAALSAHTDISEAEMVVPVYKTSYVILSRKGENASRFARNKFNEAIEGKKILISSAFKSTQSYQALVESANAENLFLSSRGSFDLIEELSHGDYDYLVCEKSEAQLGVALVKNITEVFQIKEEVAVSVVINSSDDGLKEDFTAWLESYRKGAEYAMLNELYFEKGFVGQYIGRNIKSPSKDGGISAFDTIIKQVSKEAGYDWRLLSAIAYQESKFNQYIISPRGARGLMQIMPIVARQFGIDIKEVMKPEVNVMLAAKSLNMIERTLRFAPSTDVRERWKIILASYNAGMGHVLDARRLAVKYGENPDSWSVVSKYLQLKANPEYNQDEVVKSGKFHGGETLAFVSSVMGRYDKYCRVLN